MLLVTEQCAAAPAGPEARHGVTPPFRDARTRHFRPAPDVDPGLVSKTEQDLLAILGVRARPCLALSGCIFTSSTTIIEPGRSLQLWLLSGYAQRSTRLMGSLCSFCSAFCGRANWW